MKPSTDTPIAAVQTQSPSIHPTSAATIEAPTNSPSVAETENPTIYPTTYRILHRHNISNSPSSRAMPIATPSIIPSIIASVLSPTAHPSLAPITVPSDSPSHSPSSAKIGTSAAPTTHALSPDPALSEPPSSSLTIPTIAPSVLPSAIPTVAIGTATTLQFTQELVLSVPRGCESLAADRNSQQALQLTAARYLQVSASAPNVTYTACESYAAGVSGVSNILLLSASSVTVYLQVQTSYVSSGPHSRNQVFEDLQQKIVAAVESKNFTRSLVTISKALHANATIFATVTKASASSSTLVTVQYQPTVAPTQVPALALLSQSSASSNSSLPLLVGVVVGVLLMVVCSLVVFYFVMKKRPSDIFRTREPWQVATSTMIFPSGSGSSSGGVDKAASL